ncbi:DNA endonuclease RBBP8 isoform X4 [Dunckerocampus dactyliophorus]|uniref:DNA endonuclease RBBP8 isoform X4 n=1 Tax=Dunckerocampus dactyliophorus TaxID=161453 RepID=UPI0024059899|nr:DNA endonuclease RBBP8 isoform X4 [Dunckerocampus dactyliophorus]
MTTEVDRMSSLTSTPKADPFHALWKQLWECHQTGLQELEEKVSKLKKERNLDAQRLEVFYTRNQELKEQNKGLRDAISLLEDRLRAGECDRCSVLEENLKSSQHQREQIINKLKHERKCLEDENGKLCAELQKLKRCAEPQVAVAAEQEDGIIPDSPVLASSLPPAKKLKKRKNPDKSKHVHYTEEPSFINKSLFKDVSNELVGASKNAPRVEVLVPNTCEIDASQIGGEEENGGEVIAETCALELVDICHMETPEAPSQQSASKSSRLYDVRQKPCHTSSSHLLVIHTHATTEKSPSLLLRGKRLTRSDSICREKWKKEDGEPKEQMPKAELVDPTCRTLSTQSFKQPPDSKHEEHGEPLDSDCTWVSHSLLQGRRESDPDEEHGVSGIGEKANDSLDGMFDTTAHEEYVSYNRSQVASEDVKEEEQQEDEEQEPSEDYPRVHKAKHPTFAHVAVVRKKDERRKLKGTTCKECEVYYAHLPEEEKEKKLSECSRHRHRFIPPSTPEHFWEVGFPSTQTCIERGYIREEKTPSARLRRKQPFTALFSPKSSQKDS